MIGVGEKGIATVRLSARGDGGHASAPPKITAVGRVSRAVHRITPSTFPVRTPAASTAATVRVTVGREVARPMSAGDTCGSPVSRAAMKYSRSPTQIGSRSSASVLEART